MMCSYTQISQYLTCPRRYRYRYLDGWREKDTRAAMLFGRAFENALAAFSGEKILQRYYSKSGPVISQGDNFIAYIDAIGVKKKSLLPDERPRTERQFC
jgi:CRISPR/Cas system-associated exonuclease Cas4 (RecB family)